MFNMTEDDFLTCVDCGEGLENDILDADGLLCDDCYDASRERSGDQEAIEFLGLTEF